MGGTLTASAAHEIGLAVADGRDIDQVWLHLEEKTAKGGQGTIHRLAGHSGLMSKRYLQPVRVHGPALTELVRLRHELSPRGAGTTGRPGGLAALPGGRRRPVRGLPHA